MFDPYVCVPGNFYSTAVFLSSSIVYHSSQAMLTMNVCLQYRPGYLSSLTHFLSEIYTKVYHFCPINAYKQRLKGNLKETCLDFLFFL